MFHSMKPCHMSCFSSLGNLFNLNVDYSFLTTYIVRLENVDNLSFCSCRIEHVYVHACEFLWICGQEDAWGLSCLFFVHSSRLGDQDFFMIVRNSVTNHYHQSNFHGVKEGGCAVYNILKMVFQSSLVSGGFVCPKLMQLAGKSV